MPTSSMPWRAARSRATSLRTFMRLPVAQRSSVILMDVLGCSLQEVCEVMDCSLPAAKAALHRGRAQLREIADEPDDPPQPKIVGCRSRAPRRLCRAFQRAGFRRDPRHDRGRRAARSRQQDPHERQGRGVQLFRQLRRRSATGIWCRGWWKGIPHPGVRSRRSRARTPKYFMLLHWSADKVATIRDFRHAPYVIDGAEYSDLIGVAPGTPDTKPQPPRPNLNYNSCHPPRMRIMVHKRWRMGRRF